MAKFLGVPTSGSQGSTTWARNRYGQYTRMRAHPVNPNTPVPPNGRLAPLSPVAPPPGES